MPDRTAPPFVVTVVVRAPYSRSHRPMGSLVDLSAVGTVSRTGARLVLTPERESCRPHERAWLRSVVVVYRPWVSAVGIVE